VIPLYLKIFTENKNFMSRLDQIIIEGHSDDMGSYLYNMDLSQKRANEVFKYIYTTLGNFSKSEREELEKYITANGKSKANLIYKENGEVDRAKSRRVEIKFKLKDEEALNKIKKTLE
jgi:putative chemotaxis protein motB